MVLSAAHLLACGAGFGAEVLAVQAIRDAFPSAARLGGSAGGSQTSAPL